MKFKRRNGFGIERKNQGIQETVVDSIYNPDPIETVDNCVKAFGKLIHMLHANGHLSELDVYDFIDSKRYYKANNEGLQ